MLLHVLKITASVLYKMSEIVTIHFLFTYLHFWFWNICLQRKGLYLKFFYIYWIFFYVLLRILAKGISVRYQVAIHKNDSEKDTPSMIVNA